MSNQKKYIRVGIGYKLHSDIKLMSSRQATTMIVKMNSNKRILSVTLLRETKVKTKPSVI